MSKGTGIIVGLLALALPGGAFSATMSPFSPGVAAAYADSDQSWARGASFLTHFVHWEPVKERTDLNIVTLVQGTNFSVSGTGEPLTGTTVTAVDATATSSTDYTSTGTALTITGTTATSSNDYTSTGNALTITGTTVTQTAPVSSTDTHYGMVNAYGVLTVVNAYPVSAVPEPTLVACVGLSVLALTARRRHGF